MKRLVTETRLSDDPSTRSSAAAYREQSHESVIKQSNLETQEGFEMIIGQSICPLRSTASIIKRGKTMAYGATDFRGAYTNRWV